MMMRSHERLLEVNSWLRTGPGGDKQRIRGYFQRYALYKSTFYLLTYLQAQRRHVHVYYCNKGLCYIRPTVGNVFLQRVQLQFTRARLLRHLQRIHVNVHHVLCQSLHQHTLHVEQMTQASWHFQIQSIIDITKQSVGKVFNTQHMLPFGERTYGVWNREWHGNGECGNTAVITVGMGRMLQ